MAATPAWLAAVEALLNRGIQASMQATALARRLEGTTVRVDVAGLASIHVSSAAGRLALIAADRSPESIQKAAVDATIAGAPFALLNLARASSAGAVRAHAPASAQVSRATVRGDAEVANSYGRLFRLARPDFEEELSGIVGDLPARRLSQLARKTMQWARRTHRTAGENIAEYLQEESRDLVNKTELDEFLQAVDSLRESADRVEARLTRLERRLKGSA